MTGQTLFKVICIYSLLLSLIACKRYDNDRHRTLKTACERIQRKWKWVKYYDRYDINRTYDTVKYYIANAPPGNYYYIRYGIIFDLRRKNKRRLFCYDIGSRDSVASDNTPIAPGSYWVFRRSREYIKFDIRIHKDSPDRYLIDDYQITKLTENELVLNNKIYFEAVD